MYRKLQAHLTEAPAERLLTLDLVTTYLSPKVFHIICEVGNSRTENLNQPVEFLEKGFLRWDHLASVLPDLSEDSYEYFLEGAKMLASPMKVSANYLSSFTEEQLIIKFRDSTQWLSEPEVVAYAFRLLKSGRETAALHVLLLCTPVFERSLGDLYLIGGKPPCPGLLKDLLLTKELKEIFGGGVIQLLRILIGPPISLNLRNVVWHGFPVPQEIHSNYAWFLLHVMVSLSVFIKQTEIFHRPYLILKPLETECFTVYMDNLDYKDIFSKSVFVPKRMLVIWMEALQYFHEQEFCMCVLLLLPQLEHSLRRVFVTANDVANRLLTAENTTLFTTFDEILASNLQDGSENKSRVLISDSCMSALLDLLSYPLGPRIRDHLSHGEFQFLIKKSDNKLEGSLETLWKSYAEQLLKILAFLCTKFMDLAEAEQTFKEDVELMRHQMLNYKSVYHPFSKFQAQLLENLQLLKKCHTLSFLEDTSCFENESGETTIKTQVTEGNELVKQLTKNLFKIFDEDAAIRRIDNSEEDFVTSLQAIAASVHMKTLYRKLSNYEEVCLGLLNQLLEKCKIICCNACHYATETHYHFKKKLLRSRQRNTFKKFCSGFKFWLGVVELVLGICAANLQLWEKETSKPVISVPKLKNILKVCENLTSYSEPNCNKWEVGSTAASNLLFTTEKLLD